MEGVLHFADVQSSIVVASGCAAFDHMTQKRVRGHDNFCPINL